MLRPKDFDGKLALCWWCEVWLPWQHCKIGGDAQALEAMVGCAFALEEPLVSCPESRVRHLLDCGSKEVELLPEGGANCSRCGGDSDWLIISYYPIQDIQFEPSDPHVTCEGAACSPLPVVNDWHLQEEGLDIQSSWEFGHCSGALLHGDQLLQGVGLWL